MSSILHPIHSATQKCRPKHQVLVLRCYPKYQKTVQEVKPNSSELSYLCYYASTKPSKLPKVAAFLEKKTASDVWRARLGNVQVTLQILTAIVEKTPRELSLYSRSVFTILDSVLRSKDITMAEESVHTFEVLCKNMDGVSIMADQQKAQQFLQLVQVYTTFATRGASTTEKSTESLPLTQRWRTIGLRAIHAVVSSDAFAADFAKQLQVVMPVILDNLALENDNILASLRSRVPTSEKLDVENARRRRASAATVTTVDTIEGNPISATQTTADADRAAEDEVRVLAVRCLKQIFSMGVGVSRGQTRLATTLTLKFIASKHPQLTSDGKLRENSWAISLIDAITRWTPVQDRFIIALTAVETLVRSPINEALLEKQLVLATLIDWLLSSPINLIGLSVMDVLLGFVHHTLLLLQIGSKDMKIGTIHRGVDTLGMNGEMNTVFDTSTVLGDVDRGRDLSSKELAPSPTRQELLSRIQSCIASLSTHIYYTDQITDMLTAILARLKPSTGSDFPKAAAAINDPAAATKAIADSANLEEDPSTDGFFSFANARVTALRVIKAVLVRANTKRSATGGAIEARARVGIQVWQGTQWLLKDEDRTVRAAYIDALLMWLKLETNSSDLLLPKDGPRKSKNDKRAAKPENEGLASKRAASSASRKESRPTRSTFVQLLHLAVYDSFLDEPENQSNLLMLYLLITHLVDRLGVNAVRSGLPMLMKLQQVALQEAALSNPAKTFISSIVHGYLWTIAEKFDFEGTKVGYEINGEISRRKRLAIWFDRVHFPALSLDHVLQRGDKEKPPVVDEVAVDSLKPFLNVLEMVNEVAKAYDVSLITPAASPPSSPGRVFSVPTLGFGYGYGSAAGPRPSPQDQFPQKVRDEMGASWSREQCIAAVEKESAGSTTGSRAGRSSGKHLQANGVARAGSASGRETPNENVPVDDGKNAGAIITGLAALQLQRRSSGHGSIRPLNGTSSRESTVRVLDLKRALSGYNRDARHASPLRRPIAGSKDSTQSHDSDSMVSWHEADENGEPMADTMTPTGHFYGQVTSDRPVVADATGNEDESGGEGQSPPIPPLPPIESTSPAAVLDPSLTSNKTAPGLTLPGTYPRESSPVRPVTSHGPSRPANTGALTQQRPNSSQAPRSINSSHVGSVREGRRPGSRRGGPPTQPPPEKFDLKQFLAAIPSKNSNLNSVLPHTSSGVGGIIPESVLADSVAVSKPPY